MQEKELTKLNYTLSFQIKYFEALREYHLLLQRISTNLELMRNEGIIRPDDYEHHLKVLKSLLL